VSNAIAPSPSALSDDSPFVSLDREFRAVTGDAPRLIRVLECDAHEGPVYVPEEDALYFTSVPRRQELPEPGRPQVSIKRLALDGLRFPLEPERLSVVSDDANAANGMALGPGGRLLVCEQGSESSPARIMAVDRTSGRAKSLVDGWRGLPLNSPNDVAVHPDGTIWFTDPSYGHLQGFRPEPRLGDYVYRYDPHSGRLRAVADSFDKPNGIALSPDGGVLYVTDSGANQEPGSFHPARPHHVKAFEVRDGRLADERLFAITAPGFPDGIEVDAEGRVYVSCATGVQVFDPTGDVIGEITLPGAVNFCFGAPDRNVLFITAEDAIWAAVLEATGVPTPTRRQLKGV
jgi:gluconolactonase